MAEYPQHLIRDHLLGDGTTITIRPIRASDGELEQSFMRSLSDQSRYLRFMTSIKELPPKKLALFTRIDYEQHLALIATVIPDGQEIQIGEARYAAGERPSQCEFGVAVADDWQGKGVGALLMDALMGAARWRGFASIEGLVFASNQRMIDFARRLGFAVQPVPGEADTVCVVRTL